jgi:hypothetical protein
MYLRLFPENPKLKTAIMAVKTRSKGIFASIAKYGKSPCFLPVDFLSLVGPDYPLLILPCIDGAETLECAF